MNVILDMDGTLVDSEGAIARAAQVALVDWGVNCKLPDFLDFTGLGDDIFIGGVARKYGVEYTPAMKARAYEVYMERVHEWVEVYSWTRPLVGFLKRRGFKLAVASASDRIKVNCNLELIGLGAGVCDAVIAADDVTHQKPDPEIFLLAMNALGAKPCETVVFEDSLAGVKAAKAAGAYCIAVTTSYPAEKLYDVGADIVVDDLNLICKILDIFQEIN